MTVQELDFVFPFIVFAYGAAMTLLLLNPTLMRLAEEHLPSEYRSRLLAKKGLAIVCLVVGALWSLQNLWLG